MQVKIRGVMVQSNAAPIFRFAPSPNGALHLGHAYSALINADMAAQAGGTFLLRLEDIDTARCTQALEAALVDDLAWLGVLPPPPYRRQSEHFADYAAALTALADDGLAYPAFMTRGDIRAFAARSEDETGSPYPRDPDGAPLYPRLDRHMGEDERMKAIADGLPYAWRLDMAEAIRRVGIVSFVETGGEDGEAEIVAEPALWGDVVLARKDVPTSYHLSVVVDDALQGITHVVRGRDLAPSTSVHRVLQALLGLPAPIYHHHDLILDADGRKLSKSIRSVALSTFRQAGMTPADIRRMVGLGPGFPLDGQRSKPERATRSSG